MSCCLRRVIPQSSLSQLCSRCRIGRILGSSSRSLSFCCSSLCFCAESLFINSRLICCRSRSLSFCCQSLHIHRSLRCCRVCPLQLFCCLGSLGCNLLLCLGSLCLCLTYLLLVYSLLSENVTRPLCTCSLLSRNAIHPHFRLQEVGQLHIEFFRQLNVCLDASVEVLVIYDDLEIKIIYICHRYKTIIGDYLSASPLNISSRV